jgi:hypothetical protein
MWALAGWFVALHFSSEEAVQSTKHQGKRLVEIEFIQLNYSFEP